MRVNVNGIEVNYIDMGKKTEETVVMLHGWGSRAELFSGSALPVSQKYNVIMPDLPGFGDTPEPLSVWTVDDYTNFTIDFISTLGLKKVILLGHSFGGRIIIKAANRNPLPFEITKIILTDSAGIRPQKTGEQKTKEGVMKLGKKLLSHSPKLLNSLQSITGSDDYRAASPLMRQVLVIVVNEDLTPLLSGIKPSTLLIWGTLDTATPLSDGEKMESLIPDSGLARIEGAGHYSFIDNPVLYNAILGSFLKL